jgi:hypothetical protein
VPQRHNQLVQPAHAPATGRGQRRRAAALCGQLANEGTSLQTSPLESACNSASSTQKQGHACTSMHTTGTRRTHPQHNVHPTSSHSQTPPWSCLSSCRLCAGIVADPATQQALTVRLQCAAHRLACSGGTPRQAGAKVAAAATIHEGCCCVALRLLLAAGAAGASQVAAVACTAQAPCCRAGY